MSLCPDEVWDSVVGVECKFGLSPTLVVAS